MSTQVHVVSTQCSVIYMYACINTCSVYIHIHTYTKDVHTHIQGNIADINPHEKLSNNPYLRASMCAHADKKESRKHTHGSIRRTGRKRLVYTYIYIYIYIYSRDPKNKSHNDTLPADGRNRSHLAFCITIAPEGAAHILLGSCGSRSISSLILAVMVAVV